MTDNAKIESLEKINIYRFFPWICLALAIALIIAAIVNAPPKSVSIEAGPKGGFFDTTAHLLKAKLKEKGITVTVINSEETLQIIKHVDDPKSGVDIGFIAHEVPVGKYQNIKSLGSITMDPLFIYLRQNLKIDSPADFAGLRLGVGPLDTGGRVVTDAVLDLYGIHPGNATYVPLSLLEMADAIEKGTVDVAFFLQPTNNKVVARIGESGVATLMSLGRAEAIIKKYGYLHHLTIVGERVDLYLCAAGNMSRAIVISVIFAALVQGLIAALGYWLIDVNAPGLLGLATGLASVVPVFGTVLIWGPICAGLLLDGQYLQALGLIAWGVFLIHPADNLIRPLLISNVTSTPILLTMFGVLGGLAAFGLVGLFVGPVILAVGSAVWIEWTKSIASTNVSANELSGKIDG